MDNFNAAVCPPIIPQFWPLLEGKKIQTALPEILCYSKDLKIFVDKLKIMGMRSSVVLGIQFGNLWFTVWEFVDYGLGVCGL